VPWKTWREERQAEQASRRPSRSDVWEGCSVLLLAPMFVIGPDLTPGARLKHGVATSMLG